MTFSLVFRFGGATAVERLSAFFCLKLGKSAINKITDKYLEVTKRLISDLPRKCSFSGVIYSCSGHWT